MSKGKNQKLVTEIIEISMTERGDTQEAIVQKIFKEIHSQIYKTIGKPIIQVETEAVYIDEVNDVIEKKGVLRKAKNMIEIKARVVLKVKYLDI